MVGQTLYWNSQGDWDDAQSRERVVTRDVGVRVPDEIWQGYDPRHPLVNDAVAYWPFDESTPIDEIGTANGTRSGTTSGAAGILGSNAYTFDGTDDYVAVNSMPLANPGSSWTANMWVYTTRTSIYQLYFSLEDSAAQESLGIGNWNDGNAKIYSAGRTPGVGTAMPTGAWTMMTLRWDSATQTAALFINGAFNYDVAPSGGGSIFASANQLTLGNRRVGSNRPIEGRANEFLLFDRALSNTEIQALYDTISSGTLTSGTRIADAGALELTTVSSVPLGSSASVTLNQHDGTTSHSQTVSLAGGTETHALTGFSNLNDAQYWLDISLNSTNPEVTAKVDSVTAQLEDIGATAPATESFTWETNADWHAAQRREGVVSASIGDRGADTLALGYDPADAPVSSARSYWTYDEDSGSLVDVIGGRTASKSGATAGVTGVLDSTAVNFDGVNDYVSVANASVFNDITEMTMAMWVKASVNSTSGYNDLVGKGDFTAGAGSFLFGFDDDVFLFIVNDYGTYDAVRVPALTDDEWHHVAVTWTSALGARLYLDGQRVGSGTGTARAMPNSAHAVVFGSDLPAGTHYRGAIDEPMYFRSRLSDSAIQALYNAGRSGTLVTDSRNASGAATTLSTTATVPANTSLQATIYQDATGDGVADHQQTVAIGSGTLEHELTGFESVQGGRYWIEFAPATTDTTRTPKVESVTLTTDALDRLFTSTVRINGAMVDLPVYDPADVSRSCARVRNTATGEVGALRITDPANARALIRHPTDGILGVETLDR